MNPLVTKLLRQYQGLVISGGLLVVCIAAGLYGILPGGKRVVAMLESRQTLAREVQQLRTKMTQLASLEETTLRAQLLTLTTAIPIDKSVPSAIATVDGVAEGAGVAIKGLTVASPGSLATESATRQTAEEKKLGSNLLTFTLLADGTFPAVYDFFDRLVNVRRMLRIRFFDVTVLSPSETSVRAAIDAFYAPLPATLGDILTPIEPITAQEEASIQKISRYPSYMEPFIGEGLTLPPSLSRDPFVY